MIVILKRGGLVISVLILLSCTSGPNTKIREYFNDVQVIQNTAFPLTAVRDFNYNDARQIDSTTVLAMYPDSILAGIELNQVVCYPYGRYTESDDWFSVIVLREHGEWLKTLELMYFSNEEELLSIITLAGNGGDMGYTFEASGEFDGIESYNLLSLSKYYEMDLIDDTEILVGCDSSNTVTRIDQKTRKVISREVQKHECLPQ